MAHDVFISYSAKDNGAAESACAFLEADGLTCWIAPRDISAGTPWASALIDAIQASRVLLLIFSSRSNESKQVFREVSAAADAAVPILPLRVEDAIPSKELGFYIRPAHWLEASKPPFMSHLPSLRDAVHRLLAASATTGGAVKGARLASIPTERLGLLRRLFASSRGRILAIGALVVACLGVGTTAWLGRSGTLALESEPADATTTVDGAPVGKTPFAHEVSPGPHGVVVRLAGFKDWSKVVDVTPGEKASFSLQLVIANARDTDAVNLLGKPLGIALERYGFPEAQREPPQGEPLELVVPRGKVRTSDVAKFVMDADPERVEPSGVVALRRGEQSLFETPFRPLRPQYEVTVPPEVLKQLRPPETLTWGWWPKSGPPVTVVLEVRSDALAVIADIEQRFAQQPVSLRAHLRAQALLDHRLFTGAFLEARALVSADPRDVRASAEMEQALVKAGAGESRLVARLRDAMRNAPEADRAGVFGSPGAATDR